MGAGTWEHVAAAGPGVPTAHWVLPFLSSIWGPSTALECSVPTCHPLLCSSPLLRALRQVPSQEEPPVWVTEDGPITTPPLRGGSLSPFSHSSLGTGACSLVPLKCWSQQCWPGPPWLQLPSMPRGDTPEVLGGPEGTGHMTFLLSFRAVSSRPLRGQVGQDRHACSTGLPGPVCPGLRSAPA